MLTFVNPLLNLGIKTHTKIVQLYWENVWVLAAGQE